MKTSLLFDFTVDKSTNTILIKREFAAELSLVWDAFTKQEILDQWWAPKPWTSKTKFMNFEVGGSRFYAMCSPEGEEHWNIQAFTEIFPATNFKFLSSFSDKDENINPAIASSVWSLHFDGEGELTTLNIAIKHDSLASIEQHIQMGFQGGFTMTLNYLDQLLATLKK